MPSSSTKQPDRIEQIVYNLSTLTREIFAVIEAAEPDELSRLENFGLGLRADELRLAAKNLEQRLSDRRIKAEKGGSPASEEYLSIPVLCTRIPYAKQTIRNKMNAGDFQKGIHFVKPRGRVMFKWSAVERWLAERDTKTENVEPFYPVHNGRHSREKP
jgi:hypothetical protein